MPDPDINVPYGMGWKPQRPDYRDLRAIFPSALTATLPPKNSRFADGFPPIWDQGPQGSCTAHAILRASSFAAAKAKEPADMLSRAMLYYDEREIEGTVATDSGAAIRDGIKSMVDKGACLESLWPYVPDQGDPATGAFPKNSHSATKPPQNAYDNAMKHQAIKYAAVAPVLTQIKSALISGYPVVFGTPVYQSAMSAQTAQHGIWPVPGPFEQQVGGHAITFNGMWDDSQQLLGFDNSWSENWGTGGTGFMPYWFVLQGMISDCWIITSVESDIPNPPPPQPQPPTPPGPTPDPGPIPPAHAWIINRPAKGGERIGIDWP